MIGAAVGIEKESNVPVVMYSARPPATSSLRCLDLPTMRLSPSILMKSLSRVVAAQAKDGLSRSQGENKTTGLTSADTSVERDIEVGNGFACERQQREQKSVPLSSQNTHEDGRLREEPQEGRPGLGYGSNRCPRDSLRVLRYYGIDLRSHHGVVPGGGVEASQGAEDVCRVEPPDAPVEGRRDLPQGVVEKVLDRGTESARACYLD